ncbi:hypothetical protein Pmar_PMAR024880 [Perkinsus marinus ATCC 50983]|uniref:C2 domain-containing protein n=1 Tax=Perkinsus marinus (strain ATCC 50983 / TXsc) TaxID=423536 RepID=C5LCW4_PERM5|nr:hypothetical protein Pmar_PMAR024880 [Perkinsus marinus ATCC 50983]EER05417.1 hypothetical protein Pmar_PMAR024880 [Perkinsus marinus ATCC 50983]|eukprot:XP_002773601.1 hypothetical protein Pmar_PMAR024880 [Perkinsus marinus ATCC 50983]
MAVTPGTKCELCGAEGNKTYVCKVCGKTICGDCLASGRFIGTKKCKACTGDAITPTKTPSPQTKGETDGKRSVIMAPFSKLGDAAKAVGHIGKSAVKETAGAVGAVGSAATGAVGAVGSVATGAVGEAASIAGAGIGKVGQFTRLVGSFDSNEGGGLLDMNDPTLKFGWDLYALLNVTIIEASGLKAADSNIVGKATSSDPYCVVKLMSDNISRRSPICKKTLSPVWNHECSTMVVNVPCQTMKIQIHELSKKVFLGLLGAGVVLCFLPFWVLVMAAGVGILLANSPLKGLFIGLAKYAAR